MSSLNIKFTPASANSTVTIQRQHGQRQYHEILIGCLLAIIGNMLISVSLNIQKYTHNKDLKLLESERKHYLKRPLWWIGVIMMILGEVGNFAAYGFAPASVVAPLGTSTVVANMFIAVIFLREQLRPEDLFGSALAIVGAFLIVSFSKRKEQILDAAQLMKALVSVRFIIYITAELAILAILLLLVYVFKNDNVLILLLITSIIASFTVICAKGVAGLLHLTLSGSMQLLHPIFYIMGVIMFATCILQIFYLNMAMKGSDSTVVVPTNFVFFTVAAIVSGIVFFNEFSGLYSLSIFMFLLGCLLSFIGVYFITFNRVPTVHDKPAATGAAETDADAISTTADDANLLKDDGGSSGKKQRQAQDDFPNWMLGSVSAAEVQPKQSETATEQEVAAAAAGAASAAPSDVDPGAANFLGSQGR